ncbi:MAG: SixA phosphatase family protein [Gaiellales bacterium]
MKTLHLLRHAKSSWDDESLADHERPLAPRGRRDAEAMAEQLQATVADGLDLVLCSSAVRTRQTLELVSAGLGDARVEIDDAVYGASADALLACLRAVPEEVGAVLMIGHNPGMHDLALDLAATGARLPKLTAKFPTCALATLAVRGPWSALDAGGADLTAFVTPKELR